ncbi:341_t:CDS:2, partial [Rhizophagus irregularis]
MRKSRLSITKPFSLRESINFSGRNILQRHRHLGSYNKEGSEAELQDKMEVESDNYHNDDD